MDFIVALPLTQKKNDVVLVIVDWLTKTAHLIAMENTWTMDRLAWEYLKEIVRLHEFLGSIVSDQDTGFQSSFWQKLQEAFKTLLHFNTAFHPTIDGQTKRTIQTLEHMLRTCALDFKNAWNK